MNLNGRRVLLTGASGGLGHAIARRLSRAGADLIITGRRRPELVQLSQETGAEVVVADLTDRADLSTLAGMCHDVDVLVANAGVGSDPSLADMTEADIDFSLDVNLRAPIVLGTEFARAKVDARLPGQAVFIGSLSGLAATPNTRLYNATKFGLRGFALSLREELAGTGVGVSIVEPGFVRDAGMFAEGDIELPPGVRTTTPEKVADAVERSIRTDAGEVFVAPIELRLASTLAVAAPGVSSWVQRKLGTADMTNR